MIKNLLQLFLYLWIVSYPTTCIGQSDSEQILQLHTKTGKIIQFSLSRNPVTTFSDGMLTVKTGDFSASYPLTELLKYTYTSELSAIKSIDAISRINIGFINNIVSVSGLAIGEKVDIYGVDGTLVKSATATPDVTKIDISHFQTGIYIVKAENARLKILKK